MTTSPAAKRTANGPPGPLHAVQLVGGGSHGSGVHVRSLAAGLVARGVRVTVVTTPRAARLYGFADAGAQVARLPTGRGAQARTLAVVRAACAGADLVHAHGSRAALLARLVLGRDARRTPLVVTWHIRPYAEGPGARVQPLLQRRVARSARVLLGASTDLVDEARRHGARDARLAPVAAPAPRLPQQLDERARQKARAELGAVGRPLLLTAGRLEPGQGHEPLLDAARIWRSLDPPPLLAIAGEGSQRSALQRRIDAEKLPVRLLGCREDLGDLLGVADVAVLPSRWEARSLLAQEALYAGAPLVATAVGGVPEQVGEAAELVPYGDARALATAVARLLAEPTRRAQLTAAGRARTEHWPTEDDTVAQVLSVYDEIVDTQPRRTRSF
ncbi:glycosyltransferase family 4 protein [Streptomyces boninensis]|uniref:glycosyltransferase family 4 protein n=1 Tax=Streptomyces boninensis TaxID=2039455 RepID=UPI003B2276CB